MTKKDLFRKFAGGAIKNSHKAIKDCWLVLFAGGTFAFLSSFDTLIDCAFSPDSHANRCGALGFSLGVRDPWHWYQFFLHICLSAVYLLTFYRFYVGNIRVFDIRYDEVFKFVTQKYEESTGSDREAEQDIQYQKMFDYSDDWIKKESLFLIVQTLLIVYLAVLILSPLKFLIVYFLILLSDVRWIHWSETKATEESLPAFFFEKFFEAFPELGKKANDIRAMFPSSAMEVWRRNNEFFFYIIFTIIAAIAVVKWDFVKMVELIVTQDVAIWVLYGIGALVMLANCLTDLSETWTFYNPRFGESHRLLINGKIERSENEPLRR